VKFEIALPLLWGVTDFIEYQTLQIFDPYAVEIASVHKLRLKVF